MNGLASTLAIAAIWSKEFRNLAGSLWSLSYLSAAKQQGMLTINSRGIGDRTANAETVL